MKIPKPTLKRAFLYYRSLRRLEQENVATTNSNQLAELIGVTAVQVRKDLTYFGQFGKRGYGYNVSELAQKFHMLLELDTERSVAVVGVGKLGSALLAYRGFREKKMFIKAAFDVSASIVGRKVGGINCYHTDQLEDIIKKENIDMIMLTTPEEIAQEIASRLVAVNIRAILNFAPITLSVPRDVRVINVDLATQLQTLSYLLSSDLTS